MHNFTGTTIGMVHIMLPFMVLPLYATMRSINRDYMRAAANLGASPVKAFWHVFVPLSLPGLFAGIIIVFVLCLGFYVTPALLGGGRVMMWSMQIERNVTYHCGLGCRERAWRRAARHDARHPVGRRPRHRLRPHRGRPVDAEAAATETQITHGRPAVALRARSALILLFLILPSLLVIPLSFSDSRYLAFPPPGWSTRWYEAYFGAIEWRDATCDVVHRGNPDDDHLDRARNACGLRHAHLALAASPSSPTSTFMLPLIIPGILIAIGIFLLYAQLGLNNTLTGIVLAHSVMAIPLVVITVASSLKSYDMNQEMVARSLGASRPWAFLTVTLPQIKISVISAALLAFITSLDEVVISLFIAGGDKATLTRRMFNALRDEIDPTIAAISTLLILISVLLLGLTQLLQRGGQRKA